MSTNDKDNRKFRHIYPQRTSPLRDVQPHVEKKRRWKEDSYHLTDIEQDSSKGDVLLMRGMQLDQEGRLVIPATLRPPPDRQPVPD
jgi:hypothetical protein